MGHSVRRGGDGDHSERRLGGSEPDGQLYSAGRRGGGRPGIPLVSLTAEVTPGGTLNGGQTLYYAFTGRDDERPRGPAFVRGASGDPERRQPGDDCRA